MIIIQVLNRLLRIPCNRRVLDNSCERVYNSNAREE